MAIHDNVTEFAGLPVASYDTEKGGPLNAKKAWKIGYGAENYDAEEPLSSVLGRFVKEKGVESVTALVIGAWQEVGSGTSSADLVEALVAAKAKFPNLKALFFGDITMEESEISWINQSDMAPLFAAYPKLEHLRVRGGQGLRLGTLRHGHLQSLIVETGGLPATVVNQVASADLPALTHLELWLGEENYGADWTMKQLAPVIEGRGFGKLEYLGLRDSEKADEIAEAVAKSPVLGRIKTLDLSLGTLGDKGGEALLASPSIKKLKKLDLHHHYLSDGVMKKFKKLGIEVDLEDQQEADGEDGDRYIAVGE